MPFPVVFTGGTNPFFWEPVVAIRAFNFPTYDFEVTSFLGKLLDKKAHSIWLDHKSKTVHARSSFVPSPAIQMKRDAQFKLLDGVFNTKAQRRTDFVGWVKSSLGNYTKYVYAEVKVHQLD